MKSSALRRETLTSVRLHDYSTTRQYTFNIIRCYYSDLFLDPGTVYWQLQRYTVAHWLVLVLGHKFDRDTLRVELAF